MPATDVGVTVNELAARSLLNLQHALIVHPRASSAAIVVASVDPSTKSAGSTLTLLSTAKFPYGRKITMTLNDDDVGGGLSVRVRIKGHRLGALIVEELTVTSADTNDTVGTTSNVFDEVTEVLVVAVTADAGDSLTMGIDGTTLGLPMRINAVADVKMIVKIDNGIEQAPTAISTSSVDLANHAIKGLTVAATDIYRVTFFANGDDGVGDAGFLAG